MMMGGEEFVDDDNFNTAPFVEKMTASKTGAKSACPSPEAFAEIMRTRDNIIVITLSSKLSGTHASAMTAAEEIKKEFPNKKIFVLDSLTAAAGMDLLVLKLRDLIESGEYNFDQITVKITEIRSATRTRFLLQDLGNLVRNGRLSKMTVRILNTVKIKLICGEDGKGEIKQYGMSIGTRRGLVAMAEMPGEEAGKSLTPDDQIVINHTFNETDASFLKNLLESKFGFKNIKVLITRGITSLYAADKGIVLAY